MDTNDRLTDATSNSSSSNTLSHILDIAKAAFPYLDSQTQQSLNLVIKTGELFESFHSLKQDDTVTALTVRKQSIDIEALLNGIRDVCNQQERKIIDMILNFFKMKNLYQTYSTLSSFMASQSENADGFQNTDSFQNTNFFDGFSNFENNKNTDNTNYSEQENSSNSNNNTANNFANMFGMNGGSNMKEMLEALLTPEQKSTFDNISMMMSVMQ